MPYYSCNKYMKAVVKVNSARKGMQTIMNLKDIKKIIANNDAEWKKLRSLNSTAFQIESADFTRIPENLREAVLWMISKLAESRDYLNKLAYSRLHSNGALVCLACNRNHPDHYSNCPIGKIVKELEE